MTARLHPSVLEYAMKPFEWITENPDMDDAPSLRHMHRFAKQDADYIANIRADLVAKYGEEYAVAEWDNPFKPDFDNAVEAMRLIEARLAAIGAPL